MTDYNDVLYPNLCHYHTHPDRLAIPAILLGLNPPPTDRCRVLEIGCASGSNLIPMAYTLPNSTFVGIDYSTKQIEEAQATATALNIPNISFQHLDIMEVDETLGQFDYIIAHGVYSWIPDPIKDALLATCKRHLAPQGVAYISYDVYPGWHFFGMAREMMLYRIRAVDDPEERFTLARELIREWAVGLKNGHNTAYTAFFDMYDTMLESMIEETQPRQVGALLHGELADCHDAVYFHQFAHHAGQHGLQYLGEAEFSTMFPFNFPKSIVSYMNGVSKSVVDHEQYMDFARNRTFRRTLLVHDNVTINRRLEPSILMRLAVASTAQVSPPDPEHPDARAFQTSEGVRFASNHPLTGAVMDYLMQVSPLPVPFMTFLDDVDEEDAVVLAHNLMQAFCYSERLVSLYSAPLPFSLEVSDKPLASRIARYQSESGTYVANLRHERVKLDAFAHRLLQRLDGTRDQAMLLAYMQELVAEGEFTFRKQGQPIEDPDQIQLIVQAEISRSLKWLAHAALLEA